MLLNRSKKPLKSTAPVAEYFSGTVFISSRIPSYINLVDSKRIYYYAVILLVCNSNAVDLMG